MGYIVNSIDPHKTAMIVVDMQMILSPKAHPWKRRWHAPWFRCWRTH